MPADVQIVRPIGHEAPGLHKKFPAIHRRQPTLRREGRDPSAQQRIDQERIRCHEERVGTRAGHRREGGVQLVRPVQFYDVQVQPQRLPSSCASRPHTRARPD